jgi:DNA-binding MarR family transcriptional regulator
MLEREKIQVLLVQAARTLFGQTKQELQKDGLDATVEQSRILAHLWFRDGQSQKDLAHCADRDKTTIARVLGNMEKRGLVVRIADEADKRSRLVHLTPKGAELQTRILGIRRKILAAAFSDCSEQEIEVFVGVLSKILRAFRDVGPETGGAEGGKRSCK